MNSNSKMVGGNSNKRTEERKNQNSGVSVWRPASKQSSPANVKVVDHGGSSSGVLKGQDGQSGAKVVNEHRVTLKVKSSMFPVIKGKGGFMQEKIEKEMGIKVIFPSSTMKDSNSISIEGTSLDSVTKASERIRSLVSEAEKSAALPYTHFISLPLANYPQLVIKLVNFQNSILRIRNTNLSELGIDKSIFINPKTFHLTVLMLKLWDEKRINAAVKIFKGIEAKVMDALKGRPISIKLKGLDCMSGSFANARVLYAPVEEVGGEGRLMRACEVIIDAFLKSGLVLEKDTERGLKLHATVMNASHRKRTNNTRIINSFDAHGVMEKFGSHNWGEYLIRELHLSQRFMYDKDGYYHRCASIPLPKK